jgi:hypothetical protein
MFFESQSTPLYSEFCMGGGGKQEGQVATPLVLLVYTPIERVSLCFSRKRSIANLRGLSLLYKQRLQKTCRVCTPIPESNSTKFMTAWTENFEERQREVRKKHSILECPFSAHTHHDVGRAFRE